MTGIDKTICSNERHRFPGSRDGGVLFIAMTALAALAAIASTAYLVTRMDLEISGMYKDSGVAFNYADGGVHYVESQLEASLAAGTLNWGASNITVNITAPPGILFRPVKKLTQLADPKAYRFTVRSEFRGAEATIDAVIARRPLMSYGLFGETLVSTKNSGSIFSYYSEDVPNPMPGDSTGTADLASNVEVITQTDTFIDGTLALGADTSGNPATWFEESSPTIVTGDAGLQVDRIDPDPLGAVGGRLAAEIAAARISNDNAGAAPPIASPPYEIDLRMGDTMTLPSGTYYLEDISVGSGGVLSIDGSAGPVRIYLSGGGDINLGNGSTILVGLPTDLFILSDAPGRMILKNGASLSATIYAPLASVEVKNSGQFYGAVWADSVDVKNSGEFYIDHSAWAGFLSTNIYLASWRLRN